MFTVDALRSLGIRSIRTRFYRSIVAVFDRLDILLGRPDQLQPGGCPGERQHFGAVADRRTARHLTFEVFDAVRRCDPAAPGAADAIPYLKFGLRHHEGSAAAVGAAQVGAAVSAQGRARVVGRTHRVAPAQRSCRTFCVILGALLPSMPGSAVDFTQDRSRRLHGAQHAA
jgi:hypothetical protein